MMEFYAHSTDNPDKSDWQLLDDHLKNVAAIAERFAEVYEAGEWGRCAGLLHDVGKATKAFQARLEGRPERVDHTTFGAQVATDQLGIPGLLLAYVIVGHHGGLRDGGEQETELHHRLKFGKVPSDAALLPSIQFSTPISPPFRLKSRKDTFPLSFFTRMIFSCLVDADFLDTEQFCSPDKAVDRSQQRAVPITGLKEKLDKYLVGLTEGAELTPVNLVRRDILEQCRTKAVAERSIFSLTVPTGGGKTLSSLAFALDHAVANGLRRIIYAIPFTSIIEQNAGVFQDILGREQVLEHHCNYKESDDSEDATYNRRRGLSTENWDAPVVVTTNVQLFESLFSNKTSRCRKLHNIAGSVIILDEAQAIPTEYLEPCLAALRELVENYNCSIVLCTATQPALNCSQIKTALSHIEEIITDSQQLFTDLQRTRVEFVGKITDDELAEQISAEKQVLCIVSTKPQARTLFERLKTQEGTFHLSTNMYPEHRRRMLTKIRQCLKQGSDCRVISTSLIEAGVDVDFPIVYRAMAGLDSIAQAAGRCNREGRMNDRGELGRVYVFEAEKPPRMPWVKRCATHAGEVLRSFPDVDPIGIEPMRRYFELLYDGEGNLDKKDIYGRMNPALGKNLIFPFKQVGRDFRFIEEESVGVIIPIEPKPEKMARELLDEKFPRTILRKLQAYSVSVRTNDFIKLQQAGVLEMVQGEFPVLRNLKAYQEDVGLCVDGGEVWEPIDLIID